MSKKSPTYLLFSLVLICLIPAIAGCNKQQLTSASPDVCGYRLSIDTSRLLKPYTIVPVEGRDLEFLVDTGTKPWSIDLTRLGLPADTKNVSGHNLFDVYPHANNPVQISAIGTDILSHYWAEFNYVASTPYLVLRTENCLPKPYDGFKPISQVGFYSANSEKGWMQHPVIYVRFGNLPKPVPIIIDSGFSEGSGRFGFGRIRVNPALRRLLEESAPIVPSDEHFEFNTNCNGKERKETVFTVAQLKGVITNENGQVIMPTRSIEPHFDAIDPDDECLNYVVNYPGPLGMLGAVYLADWGVVVIDPFSETVWLRSDPGPKPIPPRRILALALAQSETRRWEWGMGSALSAEGVVQDALHNCGRKAKNCKIETITSPYQQNCIAIVRSPKEPHRQVFWSNGNSIQDASNQASRSCKDKEGADCVTETAICNF